MMKKVERKNQTKKRKINFIDKLDFFLGSISSKKEKGALLENLTLLLSAGLNISSALNAVYLEIKSKFLKKVLEKMSHDVENGSSFWRALEESRLFPSSVISLIRIGEETGRLSENLKIVARSSEKNKEFKSKIKSAMTYPALVVGLALIIAISVSWFVLPGLATVFAQMDVELPVFTQALIDFGEFLGKYGQIVVPAFIIILVFAFYFIFFFKHTKVIGQIIMRSTFGIKKLILEIEVARFAYLLGTLLEAGLPIEKSLESIKSSTSFISYQAFYSFLQQSIEEGNSFQKSFAAYKGVEKLLPISVLQMVIAGEKSGNLAPILIKIGNNYNEKMELTTKNLVVILEPVLLIFVWLGVVGVALSILLPIYSLVGGFDSF